MTEDKSKRGVPETITREALGRIARLGDLYDATTDNFCALSMFREHLPSDSLAIRTTDNHHSRILTTITSSMNDKLQILNVNSDLKLSVLAGQLKLGGAAKYLNEKKTSFKSVECALVCNTTTVVEHLDLFNEEVMKRISEDALRHPRATHVVVQINWGADCTIRVTDENSEDEKKTEVERKLKTQVDKLRKVVCMELETGFTEEEKESWTKFSLEIFGDVLSDRSSKFPTTLDGAMEMIRNLPQLIHVSNDGKGKPLTYAMFPLSSPSFQNYPGVSHSINQVRGIDKGRIAQVIRIFDDLSELTQKAHDRFDEMNTHGYCVTADELKKARSIIGTLDVQEASISSELEKVLEKVRAGNNDDESLTAFCEEHYTAAEKTFKEFENIYDAIQPRIQFAKRCKKYGAKFLTAPLKEQIESACDDYQDVYVLFDGEPDCETTETNHREFIDIARNNQNDAATVCFVTWPDQSYDAKIKHYRRGKLVHEDVAKELTAKDVAECIHISRRANYLIPFEARCPGSLDGVCSREKRQWTCTKCNEILQFCPDDGALYCSCGKAKANQFRFRCRISDAHCSQFTPCSDEILQTVVQHYQSLPCRGKYSEILI